MRILEINQYTKEDIRKVIKYAEQNKIDLNMTKLIMAGDLPPIGDNSDYIIYIHDGFRVAYSIEQQPEPTGWCDHISISVDTEGKYPHEMAVEEILKEFGMKSLDESLSIWLEKEIQAVNVLQKKE